MLPRALKGPLHIVSTINHFALLGFLAAIDPVTCIQAVSLRQFKPLPGAIYSDIFRRRKWPKVRNAAYMTLDEWNSDIKLAKKAGIHVRKVHEAASELGDFTLLLSFDYLSGGPWPSDRIIELIDTYPV
uniref:Uncharacterized protein n=1 Tax=Coccidioides posadasii RMSCC 3488 TaxID=454284 RepID=A0A0J6FBP7_COCPO|nr:hypothetical protein CPAG_04001 [Coccidioides posadasii RMSCC 3488]